MALDIIKDPVTGNSYARDPSVPGSTYAAYSPPTTSDASNAPAASGVPSAGTTPAQAYKDFNYGVSGGDVDAATTIGKALASAKLGMADTPNEGNIYQQKLQMYQSQIDAINKLYADELTKQHVVDANNLGSGRAIEARSGTLGSDFATTQNATIQSGNDNADKALMDEQAAKIAAILGQARSDAATEFANRKAAANQSTQDYLTYLGDRDNRNATNAQKVAQALMDQGLDPKQVDPSKLSQIAGQYGLSNSDIASAFNTLRASQNKAAQDGEFNLGPGETRFDASGNPIASVAAAPKTIGTPATGVYQQNGDGSFTEVMPPVGGDTIQSVAQGLVEGYIAPSELSKRASGVGGINDIIKAANDYSMQTYGKPFDYAKAGTDYNYAQNPQTQNTLNLLGALTTGQSDGTPPTLQQVLDLNAKVTDPKTGGFLGIGGSTGFPSLNNAAQWAALETGNPDVAAYHAALQEVASQLGTVFQGGSGTSDAKIAQAQHLFDGGFTKAQMASTIGELKQLLSARASSMVRDNPYLSSYATQFGIPQNNNKVDGTGAGDTSGNIVTAPDGTQVEITD